MTSAAHSNKNPSREHILGVVLAGGRSSRMGSDKATQLLAGRTLVQHAIDRLAPQVGRLIMNANGDLERFNALGVAVVTDPIEGFPGPLAGMLAAMRWASIHAPDVTHVATVAVDTPYFPADLIERLAKGLETGAVLSYAATSAGPEPVFALAVVTLADTLERDITSGSARKVVSWFTARHHAEVTFADAAAFFNINTPEDLERAEGILRA